MNERVDLDARPALPVSSESMWDIAAQRRDEIATQLDAEFRRQNLIAWVRKSKPGEYPLSVVVDSWRPVGETARAVMFDRSHLKVTISVEPCRESPLIFEIELKRHNKTFNQSYWACSESEIVELAQYLIHGGAKPRFFKPREPLVLRLLIAFIPFIGNPFGNKLVRDARPNYWTLPTLFAWAGILGIVLRFG